MSIKKEFVQRMEHLEHRLQIVYILFNYKREPVGKNGS
jgi:hypothetical protein